MDQRSTNTRPASAQMYKTPPEIRAGARPRPVSSQSHCHPASRINAAINWNLGYKPPEPLRLPGGCVYPQWTRGIVLGRNAANQTTQQLPQKSSSTPWRFGRYRGGWTIEPATASPTRSSAAILTISTYSSLLSDAIGPKSKMQPQKKSGPLQQYHVVDLIRSLRRGKAVKDNNESERKEEKMTETIPTRTTEEKESIHEDKQKTRPNRDR
ncbi:unnamed protein product, partial [Trypanosoma congolense IL3000]